VFVLFVVFVIKHRLYWTKRLTLSESFIINECITECVTVIIFVPEICQIACSHFNKEFSLKCMVDKFHY